MELAFIWIGGYFNIQKKGFNFHPNFKYEYNSEKKLLECVFFDTVQKDFFKIDESSCNCSIQNITAIIGENGAGKTMLLNYIKNNLAHGFGGMKDPSVVVFKKSEDLFIIYYTDLMLDENFVNRKIEFKHMNCISNPKYVFINTTYKYIAGEKMMYPPLPHLDKVTFIEYSPILNCNDFSDAAIDYFNISTNYLIEDDKKNLIENKSLGLTVNALSVFHNFEIQRDLLFISSVDKEKLAEHIPFQLPEYAIVKINERILDEYFEKFSKDDELGEKVVELIKLAKDTLYKNCKGNKERFKYQFYICFLKKYLFESYLNKPVGFNSDVNDKSIELEKLISSLKSDNTDAFAILRNYFINFKNTADQDRYDFFIMIDSFLSNYDRAYVDSGLVIMLDELSKMIILYNKAFSVPNFFVFQWYSLSSGEKVFLNMYSRFNSIREECCKFSNLELYSSVIILVDEGELYLHPQWQKDFVYNFIKMITCVFRGKNVKFQVIFASNSPFLTSDLPRENIIKISKKQSEQQIQIADNDNDRTFGQNIHTLLANDFYLDSTIGKFAKCKIDYINSELDRLLMMKRDELHDKEIEGNLTEIYRTINLIGEPLIRNALLDKYYRIDETKKVLKIINEIGNLSLNGKELFSLYLNI